MVSPYGLPTEDPQWCGEHYIVSLLEEVAEEVQWETVRILKASGKPKDNPSGAEERALRALQTNTDLTVLSC